MLSVMPKLKMYNLPVFICVYGSKVNTLFHRYIINHMQFKFSPHDGAKILPSKVTEVQT